ncbi:disulfide bond formation protein DsbA [Streptomyces sp. CB00316]|uniref:DsbA family protein n=1 Tax=unclassified Streptomyces TaxID=2593676 RepID=UPI00093932E9|nr:MULTISPECIES: thioredoxin domain-containing protein [unclassified Streptomyces]MBT2380997.1 thioredoxin domain-containing protein [Streptomyces sp. ISL-111]MBT2424720.1 thioredoxin domain-containing protein [Streptomyces sp. ISL-112]MBT2466106.1 thioredoxin domain-containing protein [Streptomyces sp. ISL-63]OKJ22881.1 disulfide bond formation protein DsbA [Streptomyces sp. CB00316]
MPTPQKPLPKKSTSGSKKPLVYGAVIVVAAGLLGFASYKATAPGSSSTNTSTTPAAEVSADPQAGIYPELAKLARRDAGDKLAVGRADAPVVLIEYADFKCGYCGKFARDTEPELIKEYVEDGTLRIEWRNFPIFGEESENAARGAWAAGQQDRFWEFHAAAYAEGAKEKGFGKDRVKALAQQAGVKDLARFMEDLDGEAARAAVAKDQEQAYGIGATSTPSFLINGRPIAGAQPKETFTRAIETAARQAKTTSGKAGSDATEGAGDSTGSTGSAK